MRERESGREKGIVQVYESKLVCVCVRDRERENERMTDGVCVILK